MKVKDEELPRREHEPVVRANKDLHELIRIVLLSRRVLLEPVGDLRVGVSSVGSPLRRTSVPRGRERRGRCLTQSKRG